MSQTNTEIKKQRIYVLDTNVLMHDPTALFKFKEHDIFLPMVVLEELDAAKKGMSEVSKNVRQVSRFMDQLIEDNDYKTIANGITLNNPNELILDHSNKKGKLFFEVDSSISENSSNLIPDNQILDATLTLKSKKKKHQVILVTKDINLRIKSAIYGLIAEDYQNDKVINDLDLLFSGINKYEAEFWSEQKQIKSWVEENKTYYKLNHKKNNEWFLNQCIYINEPYSLHAIVKKIDKTQATIEVSEDFQSTKNNVWGIKARNIEQSFALNLLMDPNIEFVTILGTAGSGKTLLALAAGLEQTLNQRIYKEVIVTRATVPVGEDIGFLPGTEEEKMTPWMGAIEDNLEVLGNMHESSEWEKEATNSLLIKRLKVRSLNFMRGRTFFQRFVIIDEAQNLTPKQMKTLLTRAGPGTKMICLGNLEQIDTPYLTEAESGLTYVVDRFKEWGSSAHITLQRGERSALADYASEVL